jgi:polysaccharide export outer membrane protein
MKKNLYLNIFIIQAIVITLTSCVDQRQIAYFQKGVNQSDTIAVANAYVPRIQPGDILDIHIGSLNPIASSFFNPYSTMPVTTDNITMAPAAGNSESGGGGGGGSAPSLIQSSAPGYLVDASGAIEVPLLGTLKVSTLTTSELKEIIKNKIKLYLKEPTVNVRFLNYKISVLGEVVRPSVYVIPNESVTLPEALSMAGDMTIFGNRQNVLVIRDDNGKKEFGRVNLNTREVYSSPYYYLHANDVVYVEPGKGRIAQTDKIYTILPIILSALSFLAIIFVYSTKL